MLARDDKPLRSNVTNEAGGMLLALISVPRLKAVGHQLTPAGFGANFAENTPLRESEESDDG